MIRLKFIIVFALSLWNTECLNVYVTKYAHRNSHSDINKDDELFKFLDVENESFVEIQEGPHKGICTYEGEILISIDRTSMSFCRMSKKLHRLEAETVDCPWGQIVDTLMEKCQDLPGGGYPEYYIPEGNCPGIGGGLASHPHEVFNSTYIVCLEEGGVIVADCEEGYYFDKEVEKCDNDEPKWTIVTNSTCEDASELICEEQGVFFLDNFFQLHQLNVPESCENCIYVCSLKNATTFEATIKCFGNMTMEAIIDDEAGYNYTTFIESTSTEPQEFTTHHMFDSTRYGAEEPDTRPLKRSARNLDSIGEPATIIEINNFQDFETIVSSEAVKNIEPLGTNMNTDWSDANISEAEIEEIDEIYLEPVRSEPASSELDSIDRTALGSNSAYETATNYVSATEVLVTFEGDTAVESPMYTSSDMIDTNLKTIIANTGWIGDEVIDADEASEKLLANTATTSEFSKTIITDDRNSETRGNGDKVNDDSAMRSLQQKSQFGDIAEDDQSKSEVTKTSWTSDDVYDATSETKLQEIAETNSKSIDNFPDIEEMDESSSLDGNSIRSGDEFNETAENPTSADDTEKHSLMFEPEPSDLIITNNYRNSKRILNTIHSEGDETNETVIQSQLSDPSPRDTTVTDDRQSKSVWTEDGAYETANLEESLSLDESNPNFISDTALQTQHYELSLRDTTFSDNQNAKSLWTNDNAYETEKYHVSAIKNLEKLTGLDESNRNFADDTTIQTQVPESLSRDTTITGGQDSQNVWSNGNDHETAKGLVSAIAELEKTRDLDESNQSFKTIQSALSESPPRDTKSVWSDDNSYEAATTHVSAIAKLEESLDLNFGGYKAIQPPVTARNDDDAYEISINRESELPSGDITANGHVSANAGDTAIHPLVSEVPTRDTTFTDDQYSKTVWTDDNAYERAEYHVSAIAKLEEETGLDKSNPIFADDTAIQSLVTAWNDENLYETAIPHVKLEEIVSLNKFSSGGIDSFAVNDPASIQIEEIEELEAKARFDQLNPSLVADAARASNNAPDDNSYKTSETHNLRPNVKILSRASEPTLSEMIIEDDQESDKKTETVWAGNNASKATINQVSTMEELKEITSLGDTVTKTIWTESKAYEPPAMQSGIDKIEESEHVLPDDSAIPSATFFLTHEEIEETVKAQQGFDRAKANIEIRNLSRSATDENESSNNSPGILAPPAPTIMSTTTQEDSGSAKVIIDSHKFTGAGSAKDAKNYADVLIIDLEQDANMVHDTLVEAAVQQEANRMRSNDYMVIEPPSSHDYHSLIATSKALFGPPNIHDNVLDTDSSSSHIKAADSFIVANPNPKINTVIHWANALMDPAASAMLAGSSMDATITSRGKVFENNIAIASYLPSAEFQKSDDCRTPPGSPCPSVGFFRYRNSCTDYYQCTWNNACNKLIAGPIMKCPRCFKFNAQKKRCDLPQNVPECTYLNSATGFRYTKYKQRRYCTGEGKFVVPENCTYYYECRKWRGNKYVLSVKTCPGDKRFNDQTKRCEDSFVCSNVFSGCAADGTAYDKYSCEKFYQCDYKMSPFYCPDGYVFSGQSCVSG